MKTGPPLTENRRNRIKMKTFKTVFLAFLCVLALGIPAANAQTALSTTTLSSALSNSSTQVCLTSATGVTSPSLPVGTLSSTGGTIALYVDHEYMPVIGAADPSGKCFPVRRGQQPGGAKGRAVAHNSGATVYIGLQAQFAPEEPTGACTASTIATLPRIVTPTAAVYNCPTVGPYANNWVQTGLLNPPGSFTPSDTTAAGTSTSFVCHARYSFAVDGGAVSTITPATGCTIPINAVIYRAVTYCNTTTAGNSGNISWGLSAGGAGAAALWAATARGSCTTGTFFDGVPVEGTTSASNATYIHMSAAGNVTFTIATGALTSGIVELDVFYYVLQA